MCRGRNGLHLFSSRVGVSGRESNLLHQWARSDWDVQAALPHQNDFQNRVTCLPQKQEIPKQGTDPNMEIPLEN